MELTVRHLSGSRAGQEQRFDRDVITLGRNPASDVAFDPEQDRIVSGKHAELTLRNGAWFVRDLNSSNGTLVDGERVVERPLRPGDVIQLGKNGPRLEIAFQFAETGVEPTVVVPLEDVGPAVVEGRTVMMSIQDPPAPSAAASAAPGIPAKKKPPILKILGAVAAVFLLLFVGLVATAVMMRRSNIAKRQKAAVAAKEKKVEEALALEQRIAAQKAAVAQSQATLQQIQTGTAPDAASAQSEDVQRQLAESQRLIEQLTQELQLKNDEIATARSRPAVVARREPPLTRTPPPPREQPAAPAVRENTPPSTPPAGPGTISVAAAPGAPDLQLFTGKKLKKRVFVNPLAPEIAPAGLPNGIAKDLANAFASALVSTGDFVIGQKGLASVSVTVTNYKAVERKDVDVTRTADSARRVGGLFGKKLPSSPADVKSYSYDSAMGARVRVYDAQGSEIASVEPYAESADRKSKFSVAGVPFNQLVLSDTPTGDVARKVIGDAVDQLLNDIRRIEWGATVTSSRNEQATLGVGRTGNVDVGDIFEVVDGSRSLGRIRVTSVSDNAAEGVVLAPTKERLANKRLRYLGNERTAPKAEGERTITIRSKTSAMSGPGNSFTPVKDLAPGTNLRFHFSVGTWARASDASGTFWVPLVASKINS